jgi:AraC family transcriptional regulator
MIERLPGGQFLGQLVRHRALGGLTLSETRYAPRTHLPRHSHEHAYFCLVRRGSYREEYGNRQRSCGPLTLAYHPPGEPHAEHFGDREVWSFNIEVAPAWPRLAGTGSLPLDRPFDTRDAPLVGLAVRLFHEFANPDAASPLIIEGLTLELLGLSARAVRPRPATAPPSWLGRVREVITGSCTSPPSLAELAAEVGVHPGYLAMAFRRHFGCTVGEYVRRQRVALACQELSATDRPLAEIAPQSGFADQSHLTRTFKRLVGVTPAAYRKAAGGRSKS